MRFRAGICRSTWNALVLSVVVVIGAATAAVNYKLNFYGLFGDVAGKKRVVYFNERSTKFLFSYNYIPTNFDGVLVGSSISDNWNTSELTSARIYNASLLGGNITEEAVIADNVLRRGHPRLFLVLIYPFLTKTHGDRSGYMSRREYWGALGSIQLFQGYGNKWLTDHGHSAREFDEFGNDDFETVHRFPAGRAKSPLKPSDLVIDGLAFKEYGDLIQRVRASGARIVGIIPPIELAAWNTNHVAYADYYLRVCQLFQPSETIIDLNAPEFDKFRAQKANFTDGLHLSRSAASEVVSIIDDRIGRQDHPLEAKKQLSVHLEGP